MSNILNVTTNLQEVLEVLQTKAIPNGVELPELENEGTSAELLYGKELIDAEGNVVEGTMPNNGAVNKIMDGLTTKSVTIPAGYTSGGTVALDNTIDNEADSQADLIDQIIAKANSLPNKGTEGGVELPKLTNPGTANDMLAGKELIDGEGNIVEGTFSIDNELSTQNTLISQIRTVANNLPDAETGGGIETCTLSISGRFSFTYSEVINGNIISHHTGTTTDIANITVPCSSLIVVSDYQFMGGVVDPQTMQNITTIYSGVEYYDTFSVFQVSSIPNSNCVLSF